MDGASEFDRLIWAKLRKTTDSDTDKPENKSHAKVSPYRMQYMAKTNTIIEEIKKRLPKWDKRSLVTGMWFFLTNGTKRKYIVEEICSEENVEPKTVMHALQCAANSEEFVYGTLVMATALLPDPGDAPASAAEVQERIQRIHEQGRDALLDMPSGVLLYRETRDGFMDIVMFRINPETHTTEQYVDSIMTKHPVSKIARIAGLRTFGKTDDTDPAAGSAMLWT